MRRLLLVPILIVSTLALAQNNPTDSQTLRSLLEEIRQFRQDLKTATIASQRIQIALYRLQLQEAIVAQASKRVDEAHAKLAELTAERKRQAAFIEQVEDMQKHATDARDLKSIEEELSRLKKRLEEVSYDESQWQAKSSDAESQLKFEQTKLEALGNLLDNLDRTLQDASRNPGDSPSHQ